MKISRIRLAGFRGVRDEMSINVPPGFLVVVGRNGSGKSTVCDAIEYAVTGNISRPAPSAEAREGLQDYVWWRGPGEAPENSVSVEFTDDDGTTIDVTRTPTSFVMTPRTLDGGSTRLGDLEDVLCGPLRPESKAIEQLCQTMITRDELITDLSVDSPERKRFAFIRDTIGSTGIGGKLVALDASVKRAKNEVKRLEAQYEDQRREVADLTARLGEFRSLIGSEEDQTSARRKLSSILDQPDDVGIEPLLTVARVRLVAAQERSIALTSALTVARDLRDRREEIASDGFQRRLAELDQTLTRSAETVADADRTLGEVKERASALDAIGPTTRSRAELVAHGSRLGLADGKCPLCGSCISEADFGAHLESIKSSVEGVAAQIASAVEDRERAVEEKRRVEGEKDTVEQELRGLLQRVAALEDAERVHGLELREKAIVTEDRSIGSLTTMLDSERRFQAEIESLVDAVKTKGALAQIVEDERALEQARQNLGEAEHVLELAKTVQIKLEKAHRIVSRIEGEYIDERLAHIEPLFVELYERLKPHVEWASVGYRVRGDVRRFLSLTVGDELNPRFMFSSGQRRALGIAFLLAVHLSNSWSRWNSIILDDPMQHVDDYRALHLVEVLSSIRRSGRQVICAVEDESLAELLTRRLGTAGAGDGSVARMRYDVGKGATLESLAEAPNLARRLISAA